MTILTKCQKGGIIGERLLKIGCELSKKGSLSESASKKKKKKKRSMGESKLEKGVNVAMHPCYQFFSKCPPMITMG